MKRNTLHEGTFCGAVMTKSFNASIFTVTVFLIIVTVFLAIVTVFVYFSEFLAGVTVFFCCATLVTFWRDGISKNAVTAT